MASETRLAIGQARMRRRWSAAYGPHPWNVGAGLSIERIAGLFRINCPRTAPSRPGGAATADKTVGALKKNRLCCPTDRREPSSPMPAEPVTIKKYANRRLYNTGTSTYVTLEDLAAMVKAGEDFIVHDAKTG